MVPNDGSTHTVMAVKCAQEYYQCLLKHVLELQLCLIETCDLTPHSLQLLAAKSSSTILYYLIPKSIMTLISTKVLEYSSLLHDKGILEVSVFPGIRITMQALNVVGPLAFLLSSATKEKKVINFACSLLMITVENLSDNYFTIYSYSVNGFLNSKICLTKIGLISQILKLVRKSDDWLLS